jgi:hypothetical protein
MAAECNVVVAGGTRIGRGGGTVFDRPGLVLWREQFGESRQCIAEYVFHRHYFFLAAFWFLVFNSEVRDCICPANPLDRV